MNMNFMTISKKLTSLDQHFNIPVVRTYELAQNLGRYNRNGWNDRGLNDKNGEDNILHTYDVTALGNLASIHFPKFNDDFVSRTVRLLFHDADEITGIDPMPHQKIGIEKKITFTKKQIVESFFSGLKKSNEYISSFNDFMDGDKVRFVKGVDNIATTWQALIYETSTEIPNEVGSRMGEFFQNYYNKITNKKYFLPETKEMFDELITIREKTHSGCNLYDVILNEGSDLVKDFFHYNKQKNLLYSNSNVMLYDDRRVSSHLFSRAVLATLIIDECDLDLDKEIVLKASLSSRYAINGGISVVFNRELSLNPKFLNPINDIYDFDRFSKEAKFVKDVSDLDDRMWNASKNYKYSSMEQEYEKFVKKL